MAANSSINLSVAMWSGPRNISTAMMRSFGSREDSFVSDEPMYGNFLLESRINHPLKEEIITSMETNREALHEYLSMYKPTNCKVWYQKQMTQHIFNQDDISWIKESEKPWVIDISYISTIRTALVAEVSDSALK